MKTVDIKGKPYIEVNERVKYFTEKYPNGSIQTEIISHENGMIVMKATVYPDITLANTSLLIPSLMFTGHAYEKEGEGYINKTSYIENCETSAVGRALGFMGIGIDTSIASADEVQTAIKKQVKTPDKTTKPKAPPPSDPNTGNDDIGRQKRVHILAGELWGDDADHNIKQYLMTTYQTEHTKNLSKENLIATIRHLNKLKEEVK